MSADAIDHVFARSRAAGIDKLVLLAIAHESAGARPATGVLTVQQVVDKTGLSPLAVRASLIRLMTARELLPTAGLQPVPAATPAVGGVGA